MSELDQSDDEIPDQRTAIDDVDTECESTTQSSNTVPTTVPMYSRNTASYNLRKHPQPSYKMLDSYARA